MNKTNGNDANKINFAQQPLPGFAPVGRFTQIALRATSGNGKRCATLRGKGLE